MFNIVSNCKFCIGQNKNSKLFRSEFIKLKNDCLPVHLSKLKLNIFEHSATKKVTFVIKMVFLVIKMI